MQNFQKFINISSNDFQRFLQVFFNSSKDHFHFTYTWNYSKKFMYFWKQWKIYIGL